jgi:hypothetical protein
MKGSQRARSGIETAPPSRQSGFGTIGVGQLRGEAWGTNFTTVASKWRRQWQQFIPLFPYPLEFRAIIYTTESLHMQLRRIVKNRGHFPGKRQQPNCCSWLCEISRKFEAGAADLEASCQPICHHIRRALHERD